LGKCIILQGSIGSINEVFKDEITSKETIANFMQNGLPYFIRDTMEPCSCVIISKEWIKKNPNKNLERYATDAKPVVVSNQWTLNMNVMTDRGGVEHWLIAGSVDPLQISSFNRGVVAADWTFPGWVSN